MASGPLVSVVTPLYNCEPFLRECIESVLSQTYSHWDYTIVNNCSTDRSLDIAQEYARKDSRIRVCSNQTFVRVVENHNIAFRMASPESKYCKPLDADDMLLPECLERMVSLAERHPSVAIVGAHGLCSRPELGLYCKGVPYGTDVLEGPKLCRSYLLGEGPSVFGPPTLVMFRSDIVRSRHAFYNESNLHADTEACLEVSQYHDFGFVHQILTFIRVRDRSMTSLSQHLNTYAPNRLYLLSKYGSKHLTADELDRCLGEALRAYYRFLAWQWPKRRGRQFWDFHRRKLEAAGYPLSWGRLAAATAAYVVGRALNPGQTAEALMRRLRWAAEA